MVTMSAEVLTGVIKSSPYLARMSLSFFFTYLALGRRVRKTRRAFEKELLRVGMSKEDARRLSACFRELENNIKNMVKQGITLPGMRQ
jgi:hypothetical protein